MAAVRLLAVDLDGTVVRSDRTVSVRTRDALRACTAAGVTVVAVTARRWSAARPLLVDLGLHGLAAVCGGTVVRDVGTGRVVLSETMRADVVAAAAAAIARQGLQPIVGVDHGENARTLDARLDGAAARRWLGLRGRREQVALRAIADRPAVRVLAMGPRGAVEAAARRCGGLDARIVVQECIVRVHCGGQPAMELHVTAATKGTALRELMSAERLHPAQVVAIGDSRGDLPMLEVAGTAVVMGQADVGLARAGFVRAPSVDEDGCAWAIDRLVLHRPRSRRRSVKSFATDAPVA